MRSVNVDALVVGAGFGGIYQLYSLLKLGLKVKAIEKAEGVGGVWYWNNYPGAMSDTPSFLYRYSWDKEDLQTYPWPNNYLTQKEVITYLSHVIHKHCLREHVQFSTELLSAEWDESSSKWHVETSTGDTFITTYLFTALGWHSINYIPEYPGLDSFQGLIMHSASWGPNTNLAGKRVGIVGCGPTGIQLTSAIASEVAELHCFIRHPQFTVPLRLKSVTTDERNEINSNYEETWARQRALSQAHGFEESTTAAMSVTPQERQRVFEDLWRQGNGFRFSYGGFGDLASNPEANEEACKFLRAKIKSIVKSPAKAAILTPQGLFARRPQCDVGYYEAFNQDNVFAVDIGKTPITKIEQKGIRTEDGTLHELDIIVFATGFRSSDGSYNAVKGGVKGRGGIFLKEVWANEPKTYISMFVHSFPNLFMVNGPQSSYSSLPLSLESQVDFLTTMLEELRKSGRANVVECTAEAQDGWVECCNQAAAAQTLVGKVDWWMTRSNIAGAKPSPKFYYGGLRRYREILRDIEKTSYSGLVLS